MPNNTSENMEATLDRCWPMLLIAINSVFGIDQVKIDEKTGEIVKASEPLMVTLNRLKKERKYTQLMWYLEAVFTNPHRIKRLPCCLGKLISSSHLLTQGRKLYKSTKNRLPLLFGGGGNA